jgi:hypothetical protein
MLLLVGDRRKGHTPIMIGMEQLIGEFFPIVAGNIQCVYFVPAPETNRDAFLIHRFVVSATHFSFFPHYCPRSSSVKALILIAFTVNRQDNRVVSVRFALSRWMLKRRQLDILRDLPLFFGRALHIDAKHIEGQIGFV